MTKCKGKEERIVRLFASLLREDWWKQAKRSGSASGSRWLKEGGRTFICNSIVARHALLVVRLGLRNLVRVHESSSKLPQFRQDEVGEDATKDDTPLVSDADHLEDVVANDGDVYDGEL